MTTEDLLDEFRAEMIKRSKDFETKGKELEKQGDDWRKQVLGRFDQLQGRSGYGPSLREHLAQQKALTDRPKITGQGTHVSLELDRKTITGLTVQVPQWTGDIAPLPMPPAFVRSLIPTVPTTQGAVEIIRKTTFDNQAAATAEGAPKPQSTATYVPTTVPVEKIPHYIKLSKETYDDLPTLIAEVQLELIWGVQVIEEEEILKGSGVRPHLSGLYLAAPAAPTMPLGTSFIDQIGAAIGQLANSGYAPSGVVVNGADWSAAQQVKAAPGGSYLMGSPTVAPPNVLWGVRVVVSPALAPGEWLVGDFPKGARLYEREAVNVTIATQNQDDFITNLVTALCELREALVIRQAAAFLKNGTLAAGTAARK